MANKENPDIDFFYYTNGDTWRYDDTLSNLIDNRKIFGLQDNPARYYSNEEVNPDCLVENQKNESNLICTRKSNRQFVECLRCLYGVESFDKHIESNDLKILFFDDCESKEIPDHAQRIEQANTKDKFKGLFLHDTEVHTNVKMTTIIIDKYNTESSSYFGSPDILVSMNMFINETLNEDMINKIVKNSYENRYDFLGHTDEQKIQDIIKKIENVQSALQGEGGPSEGGLKIHKKLGYKYKTKRKRKISRRRSRRKVFGSIYR